MIPDNALHTYVCLELAGMLVLGLAFILQSAQGVLSAVAMCTAVAGAAALLGADHIDWWAVWAAAGDPRFALAAGN